MQLPKIKVSNLIFDYLFMLIPITGSIVGFYDYCIVTHSNIDFLFGCIFGIVSLPLIVRLGVLGAIRYMQKLENDSNKEGK